MRLTRHAEFAVPVDAVYAAYADQAFQEASCAATSTGSFTATVTDRPAGALVRTERRLPTDSLPDVARSFVGAELLIVETTDWGPANADGSRTGTLDLHVAGAPLTLKGTIALRPTASGTAVDIDGELKAAVPFIGGRIEQAAAEPILAGVDLQLGVLRTHLGL